MLPGEFAEFFARQGHKTYEGKDVYWYDAYPFSFLSLPYHRHVQPSRHELTSLFWRARAAVVRYPADPLRGAECAGLFICDRRDYGFSYLHQKARNQTRRGLETCAIAQVELRYLRKVGYAPIRETLARQGRQSCLMNQARWERYCDAAEAIPGFEAWVAFINEQPASVALTGKGTEKAAKKTGQGVKKGATGVGHEVEKGAKKVE